MSNTRYYLLLLITFAAMSVSAQRDYRDYLRGGNKLFADSLFDKSEIQYRKALEKDNHTEIRQTIERANRIRKILDKR